MLKVFSKPLYTVGGDWEFAKMLMGVELSARGKSFKMGVEL